MAFMLFVFNDIHQLDFKPNNTALVKYLAIVRYFFKFVVTILHRIIAHA